MSTVDWVKPMVKDGRSTVNWLRLMVQHRKGGGCYRLAKAYGRTYEGGGAIDWMIRPVVEHRREGVL